MAPFIDGREVPADEFNAKKSPWDSLQDWWSDIATDEIEPLIAKAQEYGGARRANDLIELGRELVQAGVAVPSTYTEDERDAYYAELGIWFYVSGKLARWRAAISEGRLVSDDTLADIGIYVRMAQRIRAVGGWPI